MEIIFNKVISEGTGKPGTGFRLVVIATINCLLHGISNSSIEAGDCYGNRSSFVDI
jgi:hypothetical protein